MIDAERAPGWPLADGADAVLLLDQPPVMLGAKAIDRLAPCAGVTLATGRARPPIVAPERVEPLLMLGAVGAVGRELALAMLGILGISFPVLFVAESHIRPRHARVLTARRRAAGTQKAPGSRGGMPRKRSEKRRSAAEQSSTRRRPRGRKPARATTRRTPAGAWHHRSDQTQFLMMALVYKIRVTNQPKYGAAQRCGPASARPVP